MKNGLDAQSPWKELLAFQRMMTLVQAEWNDAYLRVEVTPEQQQKFYESNKEKYRETQAKLIYIPFTDEASEAEAKAKAQKVAQQARGGVDFVKLVKEFRRTRRLPDKTVTSVCRFEARPAKFPNLCETQYLR